MPEDTYSLAPMFLERQRLVRAQPLADDVRPAEGERDERQQLLQPFGVGDVRGFQTEAARLQAAEQRLNLPSLRVVCKGGRDFPLRDDEHILAFGQPHPTEMPSLAPDDSRPSKRLTVPDAAMAEQLPSRHRQPTPVGDPGVGADADAASNALAPQVREPYFADKLAVGAQVSDRREAEQVPELVEERDALDGRGAALLRQ